MYTLKENTVKSILNMVRMFQYKSHTTEAFRALKKKHRRGARLQMQLLTSSKGHVDIDMNIPTSLTELIELQRRKYA